MNTFFYSNFYMNTSKEYKPNRQNTQPFSMVILKRGLLCFRGGSWMRSEEHNEF